LLTNHPDPATIKLTAFYLLDEIVTIWRASTLDRRERFGAVLQLAVEQEVFGTVASSVRFFSDQSPSLLIALRM
jgi:hypothetical protein